MLTHASPQGARRTATLNDFIGLIHVDILSLLLRIVMLALAPRTCMFLQSYHKPSCRLFPLVCQVMKLYHIGTNIMMLQHSPRIQIKRC